MNKQKLSVFFIFLFFSCQLARGFDITVKNGYKEPVKVYLFEVGTKPEGERQKVYPGKSCMLKNVDPKKNEIWVTPASRYRVSKRGHYAKICLQALRDDALIEIINFRYDDGKKELYEEEGFWAGVSAKMLGVRPLKAKVDVFEIPMSVRKAVRTTPEQKQVEVIPPAERDSRVILAEVPRAAARSVRKKRPAPRSQLPISYSAVAQRAVREKGAIDVESLKTETRILDAKRFSILHDVKELLRARALAKKMQAEKKNKRYTEQLRHIVGTCTRAINLLRK